MIKATEQDIKIHDLILARNDLALAKLFDLYGESIIGSLKNWYPKVAATDDNLIKAAVYEAFFGYYQNPNTFNSDLNSLLRFLEIAAERDLINLIKKEKRYRLNLINISEGVELEEIIGNSSMAEIGNPESELVQSEAFIKINSLLEEYFLNERDVQLAKLILSNERRSEVYIEILEQGDLSKEEQESYVKRNKDRIKKVIERNDLENKIKTLIL